MAYSMGRISEKIRSWRFWRDLAFYFILASWIGHFIEIIIMLVNKYILFSNYNQSILARPLEPYTIYGTGAVFCIFFLANLPKKISQNILLQYIINTIVCAFVEYISALFIVWRYGSNYLWNYSDQFMNLNGYICLRNTLFFGLVATLFIRFVYPKTQKLLSKSNQRKTNLVFVITIILFTAVSVIYGVF